MPVKMSLANIITLSRLPLLALVVGLLYAPWACALFVALVLLPILFLMDWFDGYVARQQNQVTGLGSVLDIAIDRVVENVLWIVFASQQRVPVWIPILFIVRSFLVDGLRGYALARGHSAFGMMHSRWGRFLVASRFMRGLYGLVKAGAFCALTMVAAFQALGEAVWDNWSWLRWLEFFLVYLATGLCICRGVPVMLDIRDLQETPPAKDEP